MTIRNEVERAAERLRLAGVDQPRQDAWLLLSHVRQQDRAPLLAEARDDLGQDERCMFETLVSRRAAREPLAQIVGRKEFWSLDFRISADVLCPRPDSETLIEAVLQEIERRGPRRRWEGRILDLGTGSGCLLLALLSELPAAFGVGVDVSMHALSIARSNGQRLGFAKRAFWLASDWGAALDGRFDLILSNPPYVTEAEAEVIAPEVRLFEPATALFAGADGLDAYRSLRGDVHRLLAPHGLACLEIGKGHAVAVETLMLESGLRPVGRRRDLAGIERCLMVEHG